MKGIDIFCASQASTAICSSMEIEQASSSSSSSFPSSPVIQLGGRALDRHNPIICDGRRNITAPNTLLTPPRDFSRPPFSPQPHHHQLTKSKNASSKGNRRTKTKIPSVKQEKEEKENSTDILKKSSFIPTDIVTRSFAKLSDLVAPPPPPPVGSSRYLLDSDAQSQFFDGLPEIDPVYDIVPADDYKELKTDVNQDEYPSPTTQTTLPQQQQQPKPTPTKQVVVLMVSLHCKGCEGKVRKHLSKMEGVTSFNIDYAAKKVTIEGNITLVGVLASVSKLKHAKFWTSQPPTPAPPTPPPQSPPSTSLTVASTSASTENPENQID